MERLEPFNPTGWNSNTNTFPPVPIDLGILIEQTCHGPRWFEWIMCMTGDCLSPQLMSYSGQTSKLEILQLQKELLQEKTRVTALSEELENPMNVHRWRKLEGSDPATYELIQKIQTLQRRLISKTEEVVEKGKHGVKPSQAMWPLQCLHHLSDEIVVAEVVLWFTALTVRIIQSRDRRHQITYVWPLPNPNPYNLCELTMFIMVVDDGPVTV